MYRLVVTLLTIASVFAADSCPNAVPVTDFNTTAYMSGTWYEVGRIKNKWENRGDCVTLTHKTVGGRSVFDISAVYNNKKSDLEGVITFDPRKGYIDYVSKIYIEDEKTDNFPVEVLMVDYDKYVVIYHCAILDNKQKHAYAWILSRTKRMDDGSMAKIKQLFESMDYLDWGELVWDHFEDKTCKGN